MVHKQLQRNSPQAKLSVRKSRHSTRRYSAHKKAAADRARSYWRDLLLPWGQAREHALKLS